MFPGISRYTDLAPGEVEVGPLEGESFAKAQARPSQAEPEWVPAAIVVERGGGQKRAHPLARRGFDLFLPGGHGGNQAEVPTEQGGRIGGDYLVVDRGVEERAQRGVEDPDGPARESGGELGREEGLDRSPLKKARVGRACGETLPDQVLQVKRKVQA
jgi:hypothetical protein